MTAPVNTKSNNLLHIQVIAQQISAETTGVAHSDVEKVLAALFKQEFLDTSCISLSAISTKSSRKSTGNSSSSSSGSRLSSSSTLPNPAATPVMATVGEEDTSSIALDEVSPVPAPLSASKSNISSGKGSSNAATSLISRSTRIGRQKRNRRTSYEGLSDGSSDEEEEEVQESESRSSSSNLSSSDSIINDEEERRRTSNSSSTTVVRSTHIPTTDSGKRLFHRELCEFLSTFKDDDQPACVEEVEEHFQWSPAIQSGKAYKVQPSLRDYVACYGGFIYALPLAADWEKLDQQMQKSKKLQTMKDVVSHEDEEDDDDAALVVKEYKYLFADDYFSAVEKMCNNRKQGFFKLPKEVDVELRNLYLSHWLTNRNGKYFLNEKPVPSKNHNRARTARKISRETEEDDEKTQKNNNNTKKLTTPTSNARKAAGVSTPSSSSRRKKLEASMIAKHQSEESDVDEEDDDDDEVDSIPSKTSSIHTASSTHTIPLIPTIPEEEFEKAEAEEQEQKQQAPRQIRQFGGKSGNPALFYKAQRSSTGSIVKGGKSETGGKSSSKHVSFDPEAAMPTKKRKTKYEDDEVPAWVTAPIFFADE